jgi:hypothetical protein
MIFLAKLKAFFTRSPDGHAFSDEIEAHIEMLAEQYNNHVLLQHCA